MPDTELIHCSVCNTSALAEIIAEYDSINPFDPVDGEKYSFLKCPSCNEPVLTHSKRGFSQFEEFHWKSHVMLYPSNTHHVNPAIPENLRKALLDSIECFKSSLYTPTVIMCRRTLDGYRQVMGVELKVPLAAAIERLKNEGKISPQLFEWATLLKDSGNEAAHNIDATFSEEDAKDILDFTIAILDFTYSYKDKFDKFIQRKNSAKVIGPQNAGNQNGVA